MAEPSQFLGPWEEEKRQRLELVLDTLAPRMRLRYRKRLRGPWVAKADQRPDGTRYYVLHRVGLGKAVTGATVDELVDRLVASGIYELPGE